MDFVSYVAHYSVLMILWVFLTFGTDHLSQPCLLMKHNFVFQSILAIYWFCLLCSTLFCTYENVGVPNFWNISLVSAVSFETRKIRSKNGLAIRIRKQNGKMFTRTALIDFRRRTFLVESIFWKYLMTSSRKRQSLQKIIYVKLFI